MDNDLTPVEDGTQLPDEQEPAPELTTDELMAQLEAANAENTTLKDNAQSHQTARKQLEEQNRTFQSLLERVAPSAPAPAEPELDLTSLEEAGIPIDVLTTVVRKLVKGGVREEVAPILRSAAAGAELGKDQLAAAEFLTENPALKETYQRAVTADPALAADWLRLKMGAATAASNAQLETDASDAASDTTDARTQGRVVKSKPDSRGAAEAETIRQQREEKIVAQAQQSGDYRAYSKARMTGLEIWEPGNSKPTRIK